MAIGCEQLHTTPGATHPLSEFCMFSAIQTVGVIAGRSALVEAGRDLAWYCVIPTDSEIARVIKKKIARTVIMICFLLGLWRDSAVKGSVGFDKCQREVEVDGFFCDSTSTVDRDSVSTSLV